MNTKINAADWVEVKKVKIDGLTFEYELRKHHPSVKIYEEVKYFRNIKTKEIVEETHAYGPDIKCKPFYSYWELKGSHYLPDGTHQANYWPFHDEASKSIFNK